MPVNALENKTLSELEEMRMRLAAKKAARRRDAERREAEVSEQMKRDFKERYSDIRGVSADYIIVDDVVGDFAPTVPQQEPLKPNKRKFYFDD